MRIREVEKLTGLTPKSIRFYESKGLLTVERNEENSYRSYSENDVNRLRQIKLFRYLDFSIEEIRQLLDSEEVEIKEAFRDKAERFFEQKNVCESKQEMCLILARDYTSDSGTIEEYSNEIAILESDETSEMMEDLKDFAYPNLSMTILQSLISLGPILWLFINIKDGMYDKLMWNAIISVIAAGFLTAIWIHYVSQYRRHKKRVDKNNRKNAWVIPIMILAIVLSVAVIIVIVSFSEKLIAPEGYLFYEYQAFAETGMIFLIEIPVILVCVILAMKLSHRTSEQMEKRNDILYIWNHFGKWRLTVIALWILGFYCCFTSATYVMEDSIICYSPIYPAGITYDYSDVEKITTGFGNKLFAFAEYKRKGNFFYQIELEGKNITFHTPSPNENIERYQEDTYLELEEFDRMLVDLGIPKSADAEGYQNCNLDQQYVERFLRMIANK